MYRRLFIGKDIVIYAKLSVKLINYPIEVREKGHEDTIYIW